MIEFFLFESSPFDDLFREIVLLFMYVIFICLYCSLVGIFFIVIRNKFAHFQNKKIPRSVLNAEFQTG